MSLVANDLLCSLTEDIVLVLDDYHVITAEPIHHAIAHLLDHLPPQLHLILATRADPPLPLSRLRARGQLIEMRTTDLRLSVSETEIFLQTVMELDLPPEAVVALERRTEGWVAGLQLAALSLRGRSNVTGFVSAFTGSHRFILDYLTEEVLSQQPDPVQSFLLRTSILERLSASLCDALTEQEGSQAMLEALERSNLFVAALDDERQWYRYHHLFAEVLRSRLQQTHLELRSELHQRASGWFELHGFLAEAVQHALAASLFERAADLIEQAGKQIILRGRIQTMLSWLGVLPDAVVYARQQLSLFYAIALQNSNQLSAVEARLQAAERHNPNLPIEQTQLLLAIVASVRSRPSMLATSRAGLCWDRKF